MDYQQLVAPLWVRTNVVPFLKLEYLVCAVFKPSIDAESIVHLTWDAASRNVSQFIYLLNGAVTSHKENMKFDSISLIDLSCSTSIDSAFCVYMGLGFPSCYKRSSYSDFRFRSLIHACWLRTDLGEKILSIQSGFESQKWLNRFQTRLHLLDWANLNLRR